MSFDLVLQGFANGREGSGDKQQALSFLDGYSCMASPGDGWFEVLFSDGSQIECCAQGLLDDDHDYTGAIFNLHELSPEIYAFVYNLAEVSRFVIFNTQASEGEPMVLLPKTVSLSDLPDDDVFSEMMTAEIQDPKELKLLLEDGFHRWQDWKNKIVFEK